jgi:hypothetical protein
MFETIMRLHADTALKKRVVGADEAFRLKDYIHVLGLNGAMGAPVRHPVYITDTLKLQPDSTSAFSCVKNAVVLWKPVERTGARVVLGMLHSPDLALRSQLRHDVPLTLWRLKYKKAENSACKVYLDPAHVTEKKAVHLYSSMTCDEILDALRKACMSLAQEPMPHQLDRLTRSYFGDAAMRQDAREVGFALRDE